MKNFSKILLVFILILLGILFYHIIFGRYVINSPMEDFEYKKSIIKSSQNIFYKLENLRPIVGENELIKFIKENDNNPSIYTPSVINIGNGIFRANLHMHTTNSDGKASVKDRLDDAQKYAENNIKNGYMLIAITDHNTVLGAKEVVKILQENPNKYNKVKIVLGMEIFTAFKSKYYKNPVEIHVLSWCINPYDEFLNKEFYKPKTANKWNRSGKDRDFNKVISTMKDYGLVGIAHPIRYTNRLKSKKYLYIDEMIREYSNLNNKTRFIEGYYQAYPKYYDNKMVTEVINPYINFVNQKAEDYGIIRTGSTDSHSRTIFD